MSTKEHWEKIFSTKISDTLTWYQNQPKALIECLHSLEFPKDVSIIDIGGGDSLVPDTLLELGYCDITVLDISSKAIQRSKERLGLDGKGIVWLEKDILLFQPLQKYDFWYDRAVFHFLTDRSEIRKYVEICNHSVGKDGYLLLGTFSKNGPKKCSGLEITQYSEIKMMETFRKYFDRVKCFEEEHITPTGATQSFQFCLFRKKA